MQNGNKSAFASPRWAFLGVTSMVAFATLRCPGRGGALAGGLNERKAEIFASHQATR